MPEKKTLDRAKQDKREGKSPSTQAGEFVHEEIEHIRKGKHGAKSTKQAITIGLSKARRAGVELPAPKKGKKATRKKAQKDLTAAKKTTKKAPSRTRSKAVKKVLKRAGSQSASKQALSRQAKSAAKKRTAKDRSAAAKKAARTKGPRQRSAAAKKAARTRARKSSH